MIGKKKCEALKKIRQDIAQANAISLDIPPCTHEGDCPGSCPRCEAEVRYLENELKKRRSKGIKVAVAGVSAGVIAITASSCNPFDGTVAGNMQVLAGDVPYMESRTDEVPGSLMPGDEGNSPETEADTDQLCVATAGVLPVDTEKLVLEGDIAFDEGVKGETK